VNFNYLHVLSKTSV